MLPTPAVPSEMISKMVFPAVPITVKLLPATPVAALFLTKPGPVIVTVTDSGAASDAEVIVLTWRLPLTVPSAVATTAIEESVEVNAPSATVPVLSTAVVFEGSIVPVNNATFAGVSATTMLTSVEVVEAGTLVVPCALKVFTVIV